MRLSSFAKADDPEISDMCDKSSGLRLLGASVSWGMTSNKK